MQVNRSIMAGVICSRFSRFAMRSALAMHLMGAYSPIVFSDEIEVEQRSTRLIADYVSKCIDVSILQIIQLARMPDRRKSRRLECIESKWMDYYVIHIEDKNYQKTDQSDAKYRKGLLRRTKLPFYTDESLKSTITTEVYFQTKAHSKTEGSEDQIFLESLNGYHTVYPKTE